MAIGLIIMLLPLSAYATVITVFDAPSPGFIMLGLIGSIAIIIPIGGLTFAIAKALEKKRALHTKEKRALKFTVAMFLGCLLLIGISLTFSLIPEIYSKINESVLSFYAFGMMALITMALLYAYSRSGIDKGFRLKGVSNSAINKLKKGTKNYWWYETLNREYGMGILYHCNKYFTIGFIIGTAVHMVLGWCLPFAWVSTAMFWVMGLTLSVLSIYASAVSYKAANSAQLKPMDASIRCRTIMNSSILNLLLDFVALPGLILGVCTIVSWFALNIA